VAAQLRQSVIDYPTCTDLRRAWLHQEMYVYLLYAAAGIDEDKKGGSRRAIQRQWIIDKAEASASNDR
jgi:hypothetical protein